jgi:hypothetical protein
LLQRQVSRRCEKKETGEKMNLELAPYLALILSLSLTAQVSWATMEDADPDAVLEAGAHCMHQGRCNINASDVPPLSQRDPASSRGLADRILGASQEPRSGTTEGSQ